MNLTLLKISSVIFVIVSLLIYLEHITKQKRKQQLSTLSGHRKGNKQGQDAFNLILIIWVSKMKKILDQ